MAERSIPQFVDDDIGVMAPTAPPTPRPDSKRAEARRRMFVPSFDVYLLVVVGALCALGLLMVYSASIDASFLATEDSSTTYFFYRQLRNFAVGAAGMYLLARIDYRIWRRLSVPMMLVVTIFLVIVIQFGDRRLEAQRALFQGSFQPGEAAKLVVVIYMAAWLASKRHKISQVTYGLIPFSIMISTVALLIVLQPDLSTAASILATALTMFFLAGASWVQLGVLAGGTAFGVWVLATQLTYAESRIQGHLQAIQDLSQANDHVQAAIVSFLNGGLFGVGLGEGRQKFGALPFPHTDSVFAVIGEELGLFGCFIVIALYVTMVYRGFKVARSAHDAFGSLLAAGVMCWLVYDALLNMAVMTAVIPPTGVPLPFISFGGSSLVAAMCGIGIVLSVSRVASKPLPPERRQLKEFEDIQPAKDKDRKSTEPKPRARQHVNEAVVKEARARRRQWRKEALARDRERPDDTAPDLGPDGLPDPEELLEESASPAQPTTQNRRSPAPTSAPQPNPARPDSGDDDPPTPEDRDDDSNSDLGGGNRRGRISRISCS